MRIEVLGTIGIVHTEQKFYWYKRKGYYVGKRYVKAKKIRKYKTVPLKQPYLRGDIQLKVYDDFLLRGVYVDENGKKYMCMAKYNISEPFSLLRCVTTNLGKTFSAPKTLTLTMIQAGEKNN